MKLSALPLTEPIQEHAEDHNLAKPLFGTEWSLWASGSETRAFVLLRISVWCFGDSVNTIMDSDISGDGGTNHSHGISGTGGAMSASSRPREQQDGDAAAAAAMSLPGILHFIQYEWGRFQAEKCRWEAEREELRVSLHHLLFRTAHGVLWDKMTPGLCLHCALNRSNTKKN